MEAHSRPDSRSLLPVQGSPASPDAGKETSPAGATEDAGEATTTARRVRIAVAVGLVLLVVALAVVLSQSPLTVAGTNGVVANPRTLTAEPGSTVCAPAGTLPAGTSAIRLSLVGNAGPSVKLTARSGIETIASGERAAGWGIAESLTVPVNRVGAATPNTEICLTFGRTVEAIAINGSLVRTAAGGEVPSFRVEYLQTGSNSWWSLLSSVADRMGRGHAPSGTWIVFLLIALMISVAVLVSRLILRELR
jgi:hypothetical protein